MLLTTQTTELYRTIQGKHWLSAIPEDTYKQWQDIVDLVARLAEVPACLLMHLDNNDIEVFVTSRTADNPYIRGEKEHLYGSGLYCEHVISCNEQLQVANAHKSPDWCANPDLARDMICYLGLPIRLNNGKIFGTLCILDRHERYFTNDINELLEKMRSLIEANLQLHERFWLTQQLQGDSTLRQVLDNLPTAILCGSLEADLVTRYINKRFTQLFGYSQEEIATLSAWAAAAYPDPVYRATILDNWSAAVRQAGDGDGAVTPEEYRICCKDGSVRTVIAYGQLFADMVLVSFIDVSAERQATTQLHLSERRHRLLADHAADLIWTMDLDRDVASYVSPSVKRIVGYTQEEYIQQPLAVLFTHDSWQRLQQTLDHARQERNTGHPVSIPLIEVERICKNGSIIWLELSGNGIYDDDSCLVEMVFICRDISERKRYEFEIMRAKIAAESNSQAMSEMLGAIAHQWRQPLSTVDMVIQSIRKAFESNCLDRDFMTQADKDARRQITFMSDTINTFRSFFKPDKEKVLFNTEEIIKDVITLLEQPFGLKNIILATSLHSCSPVLGNPNEFQQVLMNILINAQEAIIAYRLTGRVEAGRISICQQHLGSHLKIVIQDNGGGIDPAFEPRIFEPYFTTKKDDGGTGIGLYLSKMIIEKSMHGSLTVTNCNHGAVFTICLQGVAHV